jgi:hypothetical protein
VARAAEEEARRGLEAAENHLAENRIAYESEFLPWWGAHSRSLYGGGGGGGGAAVVRRPSCSPVGISRFEAPWHVEASCRATGGVG